MDKKIIILIIALLVLASLVISTKNNKGVTGNVIALEVENLHETNLAIEGMYCEACAYGIKSQIQQLDGVVSADINYKTASGVVRYDADKIDPETIALASTVYPAVVTEDNKI